MAEENEVQVDQVEAKIEAGETKNEGVVRWVTNASDIRPIQYFNDSEANTRAPITVIDLFKKRVEQTGDKIALISANQAQKLTWAQYYDECRKFAKSLISLDIQPFESVNMIGYNSIEYVVSDIGAIFAGCIAAGVYTTNTAEACQYVSEHSEAAVVVCQGRKQLDKYIEIADQLPKLKALVMYNIPFETKNGPAPIDELPEAPEGVNLYTYEQFMELGNDVEDEILDARMDAQQPGNCCTLIYTSGTTGNPKAVMISHDNITWTAFALKSKLGYGDAERGVSYLPLNHIAAQMLDIHSPMTFGIEIWFADPDALRGSLVNTLKACEPTVFFGVPRVWEKMQEKMAAVGARTTGCKKTLSTWAKKKGSAQAELAQFGAAGGNPSCFGCANSIVLSKVKAALGLSKCRLCATGAAPITVDTINYFGSLGIHIYELFGQSECTGPATCCAPGFWKIGTCGPAVEGTELKIVEENKEIIYRGRHIFMGYMKQPEKTAETIDEDGWLHSGDQGKVDEDGFMSIIGRLKELIIGAGGENIAPVPIEEQLLKAMPAVSAACVIGDKRKFLSVLLTLKSEVDAATGEPLDALAATALEVAKEIGSEATTVTEALECEKFAQYFNEGMEVANKKAINRASTVRKAKLLPVDFSVAGGELTATLKLKRQSVYEKYAEEIEQLYA